MKRRGLTRILGAAVLFAAVGCGEAPRLGGECEQPGEALCEDDRPVLICQGDTWQSPPPGCICIEQSDQGTTCGIPGFVGIARAGRLRQAAPGLRLRGPSAPPPEPTST